MDINISSVEGDQYAVDELGNLPLNTQQKISKVVKVLVNYLEENNFYTDFVIDIQLFDSEFEMVVLNNSEDFSKFDRLVSDLKELKNIFKAVERTDDEFILLTLA